MLGKCTFLDEWKGRGAENPRYAPLFVPRQFTFEPTLILLCAAQDDFHYLSHPFILNIGQNVWLRMP